MTRTSHLRTSTDEQRDLALSRSLRYGDQTWDEMMAGYFTCTIETPAPGTGGVKQ